MSDFKEVFVSYGRRESLNFVARLHQQLKLAGYDAWFDKVNIPDGEDYAARINHGIESAHNFVYVMAPRSLCSPYCLIEIEYARVLGKRVIPINHSVIFQTADRELSKGDQAVLHDFYAAHGIEAPNITTVQQVLDRSLAVVGRTDWLDGKEKLSDEDCNAVATWAQSYENYWHKHEDSDYLSKLKLPLFGDVVDSLDSIVERIELVLERHKGYVEQHTEVLNQALHWHNNQRANHYLLVGKKRQAAESWLLTQFKNGEQAPCTPNNLICESRKNGENRMTDCFVCYTHEDEAVRDAVVRSLSHYAVTTWRHDTDIDKGKDYAASIYEGIETADNFLFFITPESLQSEHCQKELAHAQKYHKRIIPLLIKPTPVEDIPAELEILQYVDFTDNRNQQDYDNDIADILNILRQESDYYANHKRLLVRALKWQQENRKDSFLLRGHNLENAKTWLRLNDKRPQHALLNEHRELIQISEAAKGRLGTEVFLSYSRKDGDFARKLNLALQEAGKTVWFDQESIATGVDFEAELYKGINGADNFVFIISPDSVESEYCEAEVEYAQTQGKRILTVLTRDTDPQTLPEVLRVINWIDFVEQRFDKSFAELVQNIELDREHTHQHTVLQQRALEWQEHEQSEDFLLNNTACVKAESWRDDAVEESKQPQPTALQQDYLHSSRGAIDATERREKRRQRMILGSVTAGLIVALVLAGFAWIQREEATAQKVVAERQKNNTLLGQSRFLSEQTRQLTKKGKVFSAMRLALEALPEISESHPQRPFLPEAQSQLYNAIVKNRRGVFEHESMVKSAVFDAIGKRLLTRAGNKAYLWDIDSGQFLHFFEHKELITRVVFSPDGKQLVTASYDETARLWDTDSGKLRHAFEHDNTVPHAAFSPDGKLLVTISDATARLWNADNGQLRHSLEHNYLVTHATFSPDSKQLATTARESTHLWDVNSGQKQHHLRLDEDEYPATYVTFSPDGKQLAAVSRDKSVRLWNVSNGQLISRLEHESSVTYVTFSPDSRRLISISEYATRLWDVNSGQEQLRLHLDEGEASVTHAAFSPDGKRLITASYDEIARLWDADSGKLLHPLEGHDSAITYAAFSPDGKHLVTTSDDNTARLWDINSGQFHPDLEEHERPVSYVAFSPNGKQLLTVSHGSTAHLWDINTRELLHLLEHEDTIPHAAFSFDGKQLLTVSGSIVRLWNTNSGQLRHRLGELATHAAFSPDGKQVITASGDSTAPLWDADTGQLRSRLGGHQEPLSYADFSPDGKRLITASSDNTVRLWDADSGQFLHLLGDKYSVAYVAFSPTGKRLITISQEHGIVSFWDANNGQEQLRLSLEGHEETVASAIFSSDGKKLLTISRGDGVTRLWDASNGQLHFSLKGHEEAVSGAIFSPDNKQLITVSQSLVARVWDADSGQFLHLLGDEHAVTYAAFSPDNKRLVTISQDGITRFWPVFTDLASLVQDAQTRLPQRLPGVKGHYLSCTERSSYFLDITSRCATVSGKPLIGRK